MDDVCAVDVSNSRRNLPELLVELLRCSGLSTPVEKVGALDELLHDGKRAAIESKEVVHLHNMFGSKLKKRLNLVEHAAFFDTAMYNFDRYPAVQNLVLAGIDQTHSAVERIPQNRIPSPKLHGHSSFPEK